MYERGGLRIVDDDDVEVVLELACVRLVHLAVGQFHGRRESGRGALQRIVNRLRCVEERVRPREDEPVDVETEVVHQRHDAVQELGDAPAVRGRVHMGDPFSFESFSEGEQLVVRRLADDPAVVRELFLDHGDFFHVEPRRAEARSHL